MIKDGEVNLLNIFGLREVKHIPPHFEHIYFELCANEKTIKNWIYEHLEGRFCLLPAFKPKSDKGEKTHLQYCAAFEVKSESMIFCLTLDQINTYEW